MNILKVYLFHIVYKQNDKYTVNYKIILMTFQTFKIWKNDFLRCSVLEKVKLFPMQIKQGPSWEINEMPLHTQCIVGTLYISECIQSI